MTFEYTTLAVSDQPDMKLIVYTPIDEEKTALKLEGLLRCGYSFCPEPGVQPAA